MAYEIRTCASCGNREPMDLSTDVRFAGEFGPLCDDCLPLALRTMEANTKDNADPAPDPALLALARLGARLCRDQLSPTGGFSHAPYAVLDRMGVEEGVLIVGYPDATGPVMKNGIRKAIADILGTVGGYIMGGNEEL